jgi:hypothetical protein
MCGQPLAWIQRSDQGQGVNPPVRPFSSVGIISATICWSGSISRMRSGSFTNSNFFICGMSEVIWFGNGCCETTPGGLAPI